MSKASIAALKKAVAGKQKELAKLEKLIAANPLGRIIEIRREAQEYIEKMQASGDFSLYGPEIKHLSIQEKEMFEIAEKQKGSILWDKKLELSTDIGEINNDIYYMERSIKGVA